MDNTFDQLKNTWQEAKKDQKNTSSEEMLNMILHNHASSQKSHLGNIAVLTLTVVGLVAFFYYLAPLQETLSRIGISLMIGGLTIRILIELISHRRASKISYATKTRDSIEDAKDFFSYRKKIHGPITIIIVSLYTIGFYSLVPEFSQYLSTFWLWAFSISYVPIGIVLFLGIRKGVIKEMKDLNRINELHQSTFESQ